MLNETLLSEMTKLIAELSHYNEAYYNENRELISNYEYDKKFDKLKALEEQTGVILSNSPTINVGVEAVSKLNKVAHNHPMLSLDKTKEVSKIESFIQNLPSLAMLKMDGLTITLTYRNGELVVAETRGNGQIGEDVLHTVKVFSNIPLKIEYTDEFIVDGEAIIDLETFEEINAPLKQSARDIGIAAGLTGEELEKYVLDNSYKNARNLASGSVRQLNSEITKGRNVKFIAWKCIKGMDDEDSFSKRLNKLNETGFEVVPFMNTTGDNVEEVIQTLKTIATEKNFPIDGIVFSYDSVSYGLSLGETGHHVRSQLAYKFYDEEAETVIKNVEWSMGRTGVLTPIAEFEPVEIEGTTVERASLHNISIMKALELSCGDTILVYKANMIIPQIADNLDRGLTDLFLPPAKCPVCGGKTAIVCEKDSEILVCTNTECEGKQLNKMANFVSRSGMNINGFSKKSIDKLLSVGAIKEFIDIYKLKDKKPILMTLEGFGKKKVENLLIEIENSKSVTLANFLCALGIPGLGSSKCKAISNKFDSFDKLKNALENDYNFTCLEDFGEVLNKNIYKYWHYNKEVVQELASLMNWTESSVVASTALSGMKFVITGKLVTCSRAELKNRIEALGGKVADSVNADTTCLINNDIESTSSKNTKAKSLGVPILTEENFLKKFSKSVNKMLDK